MKKTVSTALCISLIAIALVLPGMAQAKEEAPAAERPRQVFALYMVCFANSVEFYKQEIELAQRHGIDGFLLDFGAYNGGYVGAIERMFQAAKEMNTGFKYIMTPEYSVRSEAYPEFVKKYHKHPNWYRLAGRPVLAIYGGNPKWHHIEVAKLKDEGFPLCYLGYYGLGRYVMSWSLETVQRQFEGYPLMDGLWHFSCDGQTRDLMRLNANGRRATQMLGKPYMSAVNFNYNSANLRDHQGMHGYLNQWKAARRDGADLLSLITWNDYNEDSYVMPYRWQRGWGKQYFNSDETILEFSGYGSAYYKTGKLPAITQDKVYFNYRNRSQHLTRAWDESRQEWIDILEYESPFDQIHDDVQDQVYVTAVMTAPATLKATVGKDHQLELPAGISHYQLPMVPGVPTFALERGGKTLAEVVGRRSIIAKETKTNSPWGKHLSNRMWAGALAVGAVTPIEAESGALLEGAEKAEVAGIQGVRNLEKAGSGFRIPVKGLKTATYNIRFRYQNPGVDDARLTLVSGVPPEYEKAFERYPRYIPVYFPPTGEGFATATLMWTLYDKTDTLKLTWEASVNPEANPQSPHCSTDDMGRVVIDAIELVRVDPVKAPEIKKSVLPELVSIPGGSFELGAKNTEPDEAPVSKVTISPFAIGKYEVTNEEFERFMPEHRNYRDGYSWRDREPVIYIRWTEARNYCNWLSEQAGLEPVYVEKKVPALNRKGEPVKDGEGKVKMKSIWVPNRKANGFRLPTEAEWEYVASGRGEERTYPWGNEAPVPGKHGNFMTEQEALSVDHRLRSQQAEGTMVVGSYPEGASRDGVMDLAGNVTEWVMDWYNRYDENPKTDPLSLAKSNHRSLRGSSWGYYGMGSRCSDREYNNPNYPGYIYLGFRVAVSEAGYRKLQAAAK